MKTRPNHSLLLAALIWTALVLASAPRATGQPLATAFTYQGRLNDGGSPANGSYVLRFSLYPAAGNSLPLGAPVTLSPEDVTNGLFTVTLNFGPGIFTGASRWLGLEVRTNGNAVFFPFVSLTPLQPILPAPYAIYAGSVDAMGIIGVVPNATSFSGPLLGDVTGTQGATVVASVNGVTAFDVASGAIRANAATPVNAGGTIVKRDDFGNFSAATITGTFAGNGAGVTEVNAATLGGLTSFNFWKLGGNFFTSPGTHFLGTTDDQALELKVNNARAFRIEPTSTSPNLIGGHAANRVVSGRVGGTIGGGGNAGQGHLIDGEYGTIAGGIANSVTANFAFVGGGFGNRAEGQDSVVAGGSGNRAIANQSTVGGGIENGASGVSSTIGGGIDNLASEPFSTVGGGNANHAIGQDAVVSGGSGNRAQAGQSTVSGGIGNTNYSSEATIGGGSTNLIQINARAATIAGGYLNNVSNNSPYGTIGGGRGNVVGTSSPFSAIGGGGDNHIANNAPAATIAGGYLNNVGTNADSCVIGGGAYNQITDNSYFATIPGGLQNTATNHAFAAGRRAKAIYPGAFVWGDSTDADIAAISANSVTMRAASGYRLFSKSDASAGVSLAANGTAWAVISDRNVKKDFAPLDSRGILEKLAALPITQWHYQWEAPEVTPHIGPMAQDFKAAFYPGTDEKSITTQEADGVALATIQGLNQKHEAEVKSKDARIRELEQRLEKLERLMNQQDGGAR